MAFRSRSPRPFSPCISDAAISIVLGLTAALCRQSKESGHLPASVSIPGVEVCRYMGFGGVMRASRGDAICCGVPIELCTALAPFAMWA